MFCIVFPAGHGLADDVFKKLVAACDNFAVKAEQERWYEADYARGSCDYASDLFIHELEDVHGLLGATIEHYDFDDECGATPEAIAHDRARWPWGVDDHLHNWHWAVRVGNVIIDWTARQFNKRAPVPAIWIDTNPPTLEEDRGKGPWIKENRARFGRQSEPTSAP